MENVNIFLENGSQVEVKGIFYIFNSRYYFMYTRGEKVDENYIQLYVSQICKEVQNTSNGPVDTGFMLGLDIPNRDEWSKVQQSITKIVDSKKSGTSDSEIQYLPINMLVNLKIVGKNKFKLMSRLLKDSFNTDFFVDNSLVQNLNFGQSNQPIPHSQSLEVVEPSINDKFQNIDSLQYDEVIQPEQSTQSSAQSDAFETPSVQYSKDQSSEEVIIDYRSKFFDEQNKNKELEDQINTLKSKLQAIESILQ